VRPKCLLNESIQQLKSLPTTILVQIEHSPMHFARISTYVF